MGAGVSLERGPVGSGDIVCFKRVPRTAQSEVGDEPMFLCGDNTAGRRQWRDRRVYLGLQFQSVESIVAEG